MRIRKPIPPILTNTLWPLVALALVLPGLTTALGTGSVQHPPTPPEPLAAPRPTLTPPPIFARLEPPRLVPRGAEIGLHVEAIVAPEASARATPEAADEPPVRCHRPRRLFRRGR
jgi:hypothetical protein